VVFYGFAWMDMVGLPSFFSLFSFTSFLFLYDSILALWAWCSLLLCYHALFHGLDVPARASMEYGFRGLRLPGCKCISKVQVVRSWHSELSTEGWFIVIPISFSVFVKVLLKYGWICLAFVDTM
jgi:hypothetical protein